MKRPHGFKERIWPDMQDMRICRRPTRSCRNWIYFRRNNIANCKMQIAKCKLNHDEILTTAHYQLPTIYCPPTSTTNNAQTHSTSRTSTAIDNGCDGSPISCGGDSGIDRIDRHCFRVGVFISHVRGRGVRDSHRVDGAHAQGPA